VTTCSPTQINTAWTVLADSLTKRRAVRVRYHGHDRVLCPHLLGWKHGRAKVLAYQSDGTTSAGPLPARPQQRWRSLFVDEIEQITPAPDHPWQTADNYTADSNCVDQIALTVPTP
jgi:hypothetical protein